MKSKLSNQFLTNYFIMFFMIVFATILAFILLSVTSGLIADSLAKNKYTASSIIKRDYREIDPTSIIQNGGGVQILDKDYRIVYTNGIDTFSKSQLSVEEFTNFLIDSKEGSYHYDIIYQPDGEFWLIVTFPTSIRLDFSVVYNKDAAFADFRNAFGVIFFVSLIYFLLLALFTFIYSRITASRITKPLRKLSDGTRLLREGNYSVRIDLRLKNEFLELQNTFNDMASKIEYEMALRKRLENERRQLILDISHDLKNPLASVSGYAELCLKNPKINVDELKTYLKVIFNNSQRANLLLTDLFELSKLDSPEFVLKLKKDDFCEYLRQVCGELLPILESEGFKYEFDIPEEPIYTKFDPDRFQRILQNLLENAIRYNPKGTTISVKLYSELNQTIILFGNDGVCIPPSLAEDIFKPFVRADNSPTTGSGLGLSIAKKIANAHGGDLILFSNENKNCIFKITIPIIDI